MTCCSTRFSGSLTFCDGGQHGYDNDAESMHVSQSLSRCSRPALPLWWFLSFTSLSASSSSFQAMFLSHGPKFLQKTEVEPFSNIELYNLMCGECVCRPVCLCSKMI